MPEPTYVVHYVAFVTTLASLLGSIITIMRCLNSKKYKSIGHRYPAYISGVCLVWSIIHGTDHFYQYTYGKPYENYCRMIGAFSGFFLAIMLEFISASAILSFILIREKRKADLGAYDWKFWLGIVFGGFVFVLFGIIFDIYGFNDYWCIVTHQTSKGRAYSIATGVVMSFMLLLPVMIHFWLHFHLQRSHKRLDVQVHCRPNLTNLPGHPDAAVSGHTVLSGDSLSKECSGHDNVKNQSNPNVPNTLFGSTAQISHMSRRCSIVGSMNRSFKSTSSIYNLTEIKTHPTIQCIESISNLNAEVVPIMVTTDDDKTPKTPKENMKSQICLSPPIYIPTEVNVKIEHSDDDYDEHENLVLGADEEKTTRDEMKRNTFLKNSQVTKGTSKRYESKNITSRDDYNKETLSDENMASNNIVKSLTASVKSLTNLVLGVGKSGVSEIVIQEMHPKSETSKSSNFKTSSASLHPKSVNNQLLNITSISSSNLNEVKQKCKASSMHSLKLILSSREMDERSVSLRDMSKKVDGDNTLVFGKLNEVKQVVTSHAVSPPTISPKDLLPIIKKEQPLLIQVQKNNSKSFIRQYRMEEFEKSEPIPRLRPQSSFLKSSSPKRLVSPKINSTNSFPLIKKLILGDNKHTEKMKGKKSNFSEKTEASKEAASPFAALTLSSLESSNSIPNENNKKVLFPKENKSISVVETNKIGKLSREEPKTKPTDVSLKHHPVLNKSATWSAGDSITMTNDTTQSEANSNSNETQLTEINTLVPNTSKQKLPTQQNEFTPNRRAFSTGNIDPSTSYLIINLKNQNQSKPSTLSRTNSLSRNGSIAIPRLKFIFTGYTGIIILASILVPIYAIHTGVKGETNFFLALFTSLSFNSIGWLTACRYWHFYSKAVPEIEANEEVLMPYSK